jgi:hypothetical protein
MSTLEHSPCQTRNKLKYHSFSEGAQCRAGLTSQNAKAFSRKMRIYL